ncbi:MAG: thioredoxin domain-containing protein [Leucobacter sp.]|nr:thioredoxin domain-containing protein [Leucobacter sp.]
MSENEQPQPETPQPDGAPSQSAPQEAAQPESVQQPAAQPESAQSPTAQLESAPQQSAQPQWVAVAPAHPYAVDGAASPGGATPGRGLAISAMAIGLVAILTTAVSAFYFSSLVLLGALLGLVAIVLGIIALVKRQRPRGAGIAGLVTGALSIVLTLGLGVFAVGALLVPGAAGTAGGNGSAAPTPDGGDGGSGGTGGESGSTLEWPANMATGGITFGPGGVPIASDPLQPGTAPPIAPVLRDGTHHDVLIYVDYRCPHCSAFEQANQQLLDELVMSDDTTVEIVPLTFLDRASEGAYYSSRASAAMACTVDAQPELAWNLHTNLLNPLVQPGAGPGLTNEELVQLADASTDARLDPIASLDPEVADCIRNERFVPFAKALNDWVFTNSVPNAIDPGLRVEGTPLAVVNGVPYEGEPSDGEAFQAFFDEHTR